ncbi:DNA methyltransferase, partial [Terrisporobacter petrolearius]|uniref:DNA methyltransferase n=1 Tax=Terrisporobacter petrolearius TaxID=1460447 RepID=UPI0022E07D62
IFKDDERIYVNNEYIIGKIQELALKYDEKLISTLLNNDEMKSHFFKEVGGALIFKREEFIEFIGGKYYLEDSYTKYRNKIGLVVENNYIKENRDVVLNWAYKDCVLEGGQDREDAKQDEVFYNEILASDDIDRLYENKVVTNFKKFDENGESEVLAINENDNLIIKGNNLIALHSIKDRYKGKVKVIFIDPPYNTNNDSFNYNDKFTRSTWLTFVKNRLDVAKQLLAEDGTIWVTLSDVQAHYFKVLADGIFDEENFLGDVIWQSRKSVSNDTFISLSTNHVFVYAKNKSVLNKNKFRLKMDTSKFKYDDNDGKGLYRCDPFDAPEERKNLCYEIVNPNTGTVYKPATGRHWSTTESEYKRLYSEGRIAFGTKGTSKPQLKVYLEEEIKKGKGATATTLWNDIDTTTNATKDLEKLFGSKVFKNPKPEQLIERILEIASNENDIVLDYHLGSGTTCATAHKMNRKYIGIEQMDYIEDISVERLKKVIEGEQTGISQSLNWQGGGSFVYCELMKWNEVFINKIEKSTDSKELIDIWNEMKEKSFLSYRVKVNEIDKNMSEFEELSLEQQKEFLIEILDKNHLYVNLSEIDDITYNVSDEDKKLNKEFYGLK